MRLQTTSLWRLALLAFWPWLVILAVLWVLDHFASTRSSIQDEAFMALPFAFVLTLSVASQAIQEMCYLDMLPDAIRIGYRFRRAEDAYPLQGLRGWGYDRVEQRGLRVFGKFELVVMPGRWGIPSQAPTLLIMEFEGSRLLKIKPWLFDKEPWAAFIEALRQVLPEREAAETGPD